MARKHVHLSELQLAVMRVLWSRQEASTADVVAGLAPGRRLAHTTVATLLTRLQAKGVVTHQKDGRVLVYRALVTEPEVRRSMVADLVAALFKGDPSALVAHLVREDAVTPTELAGIRARLKESDHV
jgi:predicted transcriptional regulator